MDWIKVEDGMPPIGKVCLLYQTYPRDTAFNCRADPLERNFFHVGGLRYNGQFVSYEDQYSQNELNYITHWMPLPPKPSKAEGDRLSGAFEEE